MKFLVLQDIDGTTLKKGMVIDDRENIFMTIKLSEKFYKANPHAFTPVDEE